MRVHVGVCGVCARAPVPPSWRWSFLIATGASVTIVVSGGKRGGGHGSPPRACLARLAPQPPAKAEPHPDQRQQQHNNNDDEANNNNNNDNKNQKKQRARQRRRRRTKTGPGCPVFVCSPSIVFAFTHTTGGWSQRHHHARAPPNQPNATQPDPRLCDRFFCFSFFTRSLSRPRGEV